MKKIFSFVHLGSFYFLSAVLFGASPANGRRESPRRNSPRNFADDFRDGIPGWPSFSLAQDEGYGGHNLQRYFAGQTRSFHANRRAALSSNVPADAEITLRKNKDVVQLFASHPATLNIGVRSHFRSVTVVNKQINAPQEGPSIELKLKDGEPTVHVAY